MELRSAVEGVDYNNAALKDLFNYALNEPISSWRMSNMDILSFEAFVEHLAQTGRQSVLEQDVPSHVVPLHRMTATPESRPFMAATPESQPVMAATTESRQVMAATPETHPSMATSSEPHHEMASSPESPAIMASTPGSSAVMDIASVFLGIMNVPHEAIKMCPRLLRLVSSLVDPPLLSVQAACITVGVSSPVVLKDPTPELPSPIVQEYLTPVVPTLVIPVVPELPVPEQPATE